MLKENSKIIIQSHVSKLKLMNAAIEIYYFCILLLDDHIAILHAFS